MTKHEKPKTAQQLALPTIGDPFERYANSVAPQTIIGTLLKFSKGEYFAGKDEVPVPLGTCFIVNLDAAVAGWTKWVLGRPVKHALVRIADGLPAQREELGDSDKEQWEYKLNGGDERRDPWQQVNYLPMIDADGKVYTLTITSIAGLKEVASLCAAYAVERKTRTDVFPLIELGVGSFQHRDRSIGRIKFPTLNIIGYEPKEKFKLEAEPTTLPAPPVEDEEPPPHTDVPSGRDDDDEEIPF
jgi:hypothetical protein